MAYLGFVDAEGAYGVGAPPALCLLEADQAVPATIVAATGAGAQIETPLRPAIGAAVSLRHPVAGVVDAIVTGHARHGLHLAFTRGEASVGFALAYAAARLGATG